MKTVNKAIYLCLLFLAVINANYQITLKNDIDELFVKYSIILTNHSTILEKHKWVKFVPSKFTEMGNHKFVFISTKTKNYEDAVEDCHAKGSKLLSIERSKEYKVLKELSPTAVIWQTFGKSMGKPMPLYGETNHILMTLSSNEVDVIETDTDQLKCAIFNVATVDYSYEECNVLLNYACQIKKHHRLNLLAAATPSIERLKGKLKAIKEVIDLESEKYEFKPMENADIEEQFKNHKCQGTQNDNKVSEFLELSTLLENLRKFLRPIDAAEYYMKLEHFLTKIYQMKTPATATMAALQLFGHQIAFSTDGATICLAPTTSSTIATIPNMNNYLLATDENVKNAVEFVNFIKSSFPGSPTLPKLKNNVVAHLLTMMESQAKQTCENYYDTKIVNVKNRLDEHYNTLQKYPGQWQKFATNLVEALDGETATYRQKLEERVTIKYDGDVFKQNVKNIVQGEYDTPLFQEKIDTLTAQNKLTTEMKKEVTNLAHEYARSDKFKTVFKSKMYTYVTTDQKFSRKLDDVIYDKCQLKCEFDETKQNRLTSSERKAFSKDSFKNAWWNKDVLDVVHLLITLGILLILFFNVTNLLCYQFCHTHNGIKKDQINKMIKDAAQELLELQMENLDENEQESKPNSRLLRLFRSKSVQFADPPSPTISEFNPVI